MRVIDQLNAAKSPIFSYEMLPPLRGKGLDKLYGTMDLFQEFEPKYVNITTHRSETIFKETEGGLFQKVSVRKRPGTIAIAAAIKTKYNINVVPHMLCSGFSKEETEYALLDLNYLGIYDLLLIRGDKAKHDSVFKPEAGGNGSALELQEQVNQFNKGILVDGSEIQLKEKFSYSVAGYPEKHEESPNMQNDLMVAKKKVDQGADFIVTQMFFDNQKYFSFVNMCREAGINVPIIPGLKPITLMNQLTILPKVFKSDIPEAFANELRKCKNNEAATEVGVEWCTAQAKELAAAGVPNIHFYTLLARQSVARVARAIF